MSFVVIVRFTEARLKRYGFITGVKMRYVAERLYSELNDTFLTLFGKNCGYACRCGAERLPDNNGGEVKQVREQHTLNAEMTEKHYCIVVGINGMIKHTVTLVAVFLYYIVKAFCDFIVFGFDIAGLHNGILVPLIKVV